MKLDVNYSSFLTFCTELKKIYDNLDGKANLKEPYNENNYIEFEAINKGHIKIKGNLKEYNHELKFENEIDQTYLNEFINQLSNYYN